jgi:uncharacterized protein YdeI (YjbR/CyaY-like superfamily)
MAPFIVNPDNVREFKTGDAFYKWLKANHDKAEGVWIKIHKKGSGLQSITALEAIDAILCWGWIDGIRKGFDDKSFLQRYCPRRPKSVWSQINRDKVAALTKAGLMQPSGQAEVDKAKADGRWDAAYSVSKTEVPEDLLRADLQRIASIDGVRSVGRTDEGVRVVVGDQQRDAPKVEAALAGLGATATRQEYEPSYEDLFVSIIERDRAQHRVVEAA